MISAKFPGTCRCCGIRIHAGDRVHYKPGAGVRCPDCGDFSSSSSSSSSSPSSSAPRTIAQALPALDAPRTRREITASGEVRTPKEPANLSLFRSFPGARWTGECWSVSVADADLPRTLDLARRLQLAIAPELVAREQVLVAQACAAATAAAQDAGVAGLFPFQGPGVMFFRTRRSGILGDEMGLGKQQPVDARVLTPTGWREIGTLCRGDQVIGSGGMPVAVTGVFPQGVKPSYRVTFSDGASVEAGPEHLWTVLHRCGGRRWEELTLTTAQLRDRPQLERNHENGRITLLDLSKSVLHLPMLSAPVEFESAYSLPVPAYLLGQLLANGSLGHGTPSLSVNGADWPEIRARLCGDGVVIGAVNDYGTVVRSFFPGLLDCIRDMKLTVLSLEKFIPRRYFRASVQDRIALLHGLMDGDGSVSRDRNRVGYFTGSYQLALDVQELVEGLGGIASIREYTSRETPEYSVRIRLPRSIPPFSVTRKLSRYVPGAHAHPCRTVVSVEYVREVESVCIAVDAPDQLYCTEHCILTHNTVQFLAALPRDASAAVLVIAPAVVKFNWRAEASKWAPGYTPVVLSGRGSFRWPAPGEIVIINYDLLPAAEAVTPPTTPIWLCADEVHYAKSHKAARSIKLKALVASVMSRGGKAFGMTGTVLPNRPFDLWGCLCALGIERDVFQRGFYQFLELFGAKKDKWGGYTFGRPSAEVPERLRRVMLRRLRADVLPDLPSKLYSRLAVNGTSKKLTAAMDELWEEYEGDIKAGKLPPFTRFSEVRAELAAARIPALEELVESYEEAEEPVLVFSAHRAPVDAIGSREGWAAITGDVSAERRSEIVAAFQAGQLKGVALTIAAGGVGLTLTRAHTVIFADSAWNPSDNAQAEDRACRIGQAADHVQVIRMTSDHVLDQHVEDLLLAKQAMIHAAIEAEAVATIPPLPEPQVVAADRPALKFTGTMPPPSGYAVQGADGSLDFYRVRVYGEWSFLFTQAGPELIRRGAVNTATGEIRSGNPAGLLTMLAKIQADPQAAATRYGLELGVCSVCGRALTDETSRQLGIGPVCRERFGC